MVEIKVTTKLEFNQAGIRKILTDPNMYADMKRRADAIAQGANDGVKKDSEDEVDPYLATELVLEDPRAAASVLTRTRRGKRDNLRHGTLLKNLDKGR